MQTLHKPLANTLEQANRSSQSHGQTGAVVSLDGAKRELMIRLSVSLSTGTSARGSEPSEALEAGKPLGAIGAARIPPEVPAKLAEECVTKRLPPSVQSYLDAMEHRNLVAASVGGHPPAKPNLSSEERSQVSFELAVLEQILSPALTRGAELTVEVSKFLSRFAFGLSHDESAKQLKLDSWCEDLEQYPLYAVKRALGYWRRNAEREPSFAEVIADVKLFMGDKVRERKQLLERL